MLKNPHVRIVDPHEKSRELNFQVKKLANELRELLPLDKARAITRVCLEEAKNEHDQLAPQKLVALLTEKVSKARLAIVREQSFQRHCTIRNIAHYDRKGKNNRMQILGELCEKAGYQSLDEVKAEFPHLWIRTG